MSRSPTRRLLSPRIVTVLSLSAMGWLVAFAPAAQADETILAQAIPDTPPTDAPPATGQPGPAQEPAPREDEEVEEPFDFDELEEVEPAPQQEEEPLRDGRRPRSPRLGQPATVDRATREEIRREVMEEVRRELDRTRDEIAEQLQGAEAEADARAYDAEQLRELRQSVNLLQLHGYFRARADLFKDLDLGRGVDPGGFPLFPQAQGSSYLGTANMRLRLNPVLRVSDSIAIYGQFDALDNAVAGQSPLGEPFFDPGTPAHILTNRVAPSLLQVKRVWAEIETPLGQLALGRKPMHFGEGMVFNDGNCLDCDYGTTFDRVQFTVGPFLGGHLLTAAVDRLASGQLSSNDPALSLWGNYGQPFDLQALDDAMRLSLQVTRVSTPREIRRRLDEGGWVLNYGGIFGYRFQHSQSLGLSRVDEPEDPSRTLGKIDAQVFELNLWGELLAGKLRLSTEVAGVLGSFESRIAEEALVDQALDLQQAAGVLRGQYSFLRGDSLLVGLDLGVASGDRANGMGARPGRPGSAPDGSTAPGDIDGPQFGPGDTVVTNFRMNPDFRIDQILWRNLFTNITSAFFVRPEVRFKPGGRRTGGGDDHGLELSGALIYSQAVNAESAPGGASPLGVEANAAITYTSKDQFFLGFVYGALFPLSGLSNPNPPEGETGDASVAQIFRGIVGVTF